MSDQAVLDILKQRGEQAQVSAFSPHDFQRTFISNLLDTGADISTVQKLAGHASPVTTARYDRQGEAMRSRIWATTKASRKPLAFCELDPDKSRS